MKPLLAKVRPTGGYARLVHLGLLSLLPIIVFIFVLIDFAPGAFAIVLLSKWRMFAVKVRFWPVNIRANAVDIMVGLASVVFMLQTTSVTWQIVWALVYIVWLTAIKPFSKTLWVGVQAMVGFLFGLAALFLAGDNYPTIVLVITTGMICYFAARHFFDAFEETYTKLLSYMWAFFGSSVVWVLSHWLLYYPANGLISQPMLLLVTIGYGLAALYYLDHTQRLSSLVRNQFIFIMAAITILILVFSDWSDKIV